jgi:GNAT superfamily N-acetyltransferase
MNQLKPPLFIRHSGYNPDFKDMVFALDEELYQRNGAIQKQYEPFNQIDQIKHAIVVYLDGKPVGCGCIKKFDEHTVEIKRMFILPEMRGRKLGVQLLEELELWAKEEGFSEAVLETGIRQPEAQSLYLKSGYERTENYSQYFGMAESICYKKALQKE